MVRAGNGENKGKNKLRLTMMRVQLGWRCDECWRKRRSPNASGDPTSSSSISAYPQAVVLTLARSSRGVRGCNRDHVLHDKFPSASRVIAPPRRRII